MTIFDPAASLASIASISPDLLASLSPSASASIASATGSSPRMAVIRARMSGGHVRLFLVLRLLHVGSIRGLACRTIFGL